MTKPYRILDIGRNENLGSVVSWDNPLGSSRLSSGLRLADVFFEVCSVMRGFNSPSGESPARMSRFRT